MCFGPHLVQFVMFVNIVARISGGIAQVFWNGCLK